MDLKEKMRQLAQIEYRAKHSARTATVNIQKVFGFHAVDLANVQELFGKFDASKVKKFNNDSEYDAELAAKFPDGTDKFFDPMICQIKNNKLYETVITFEGRVGYAAVRKKLYVVDLFHGETKELPLPLDTRGFWPLEFVDDEHFLIINKHSSRLHLFKFDLDEFTLEELDSIYIDARLRDSDLLADQLESGKFVLRAYTGNGYDIQSTNVIDGQIVLGEIVRMEGSFAWATLNGSSISALSINNKTALRFRKFDLDTKQMEVHEIPAIFINDRMLNLWGYDFLCKLSANRAYVAYKSPDMSWKVAMLNTETHEWSATGIEILDRVHSIHVDQNEILTVIAGGCFGETTTVYRFPLKKPDTLVNLAWFAYIRRLKATGKRGYNTLFSRLPYTCHLRLALSMEKKVNFK